MIDKTFSDYAQYLNMYIINRKNKIMYDNLCNI